MAIVANPTDLTLTALNSSKSAYGRISFPKAFFETYVVEPRPEADDEEEDSRPQVLGLINVKSVLSILRHRTVPDTVEQCEIVIIDGKAPSQPKDTQQQDIDELEETSLASVFVLRLHCKHHVVKTHRLPLSFPTSSSALVPTVPSATAGTKAEISIGPRALKELLEHFALGGISSGSSKDVQLEWEFGFDDLKVRSLEVGLSAAKGKGQDNRILTEISVEASEFDTYHVPNMTSLCFHLREFNASTALAEGLSLPLTIEFTTPGEPLSIKINSQYASSSPSSQDIDSLFVLSTSKSWVNANGDPAKRKAPNEADATRRKKLAVSSAGAKSKAVEIDKRQQRLVLQKARARPITPSSRGGERETPTRDSLREDTPGSQVMPIGIDLEVEGDYNGGGGGDERMDFDEMDAEMDDDERRSATPTAGPSSRRNQQPLFLSSQASQDHYRPSLTPVPRPPPFSQLSQADQEIIRSSGLGIEHMDADEFERMWEDEGEEVVSPASKVAKDDTEMNGEETKKEEDELEDSPWPETQVPALNRRGKPFQAFFSD